MQISKLLYRPWGETRFSTGTTPTTWRFTGQREDATIGLYYFNARYLDPVLGRFISPDTIVPEPGNPQALNRYSYGLNRPTVLIDPTGHVAHPNCQGTGAAIADCGVDGWFGYEDYAVRKELLEIGQREGDAVASAILNVYGALAGIVSEPLDYIATGAACLSGDCSVTAVALAALPFAKGSMASLVDEVAFYVRTAGEAIPATGYRYVSSSAPYLDELVRTGSIPANPKGTYVSFDRFDDPATAAGKLQVPHDAAIRVEFDTLQIIDDVRVPQGQWGTASHLEPLTVDFARFGPGGATQAITNLPIQAREIVDLRTGKVLRGR